MIDTIIYVIGNILNKNRTDMAGYPQIIYVKAV